ERRGMLVGLSTAVGKSLGYVSIGDIDRKYAARDGQFKYLELNPRLGLCHYFGTRCGVNLTLDAYRLACGKTLDAGVAQVDGRRFLAVLEELGGRFQSGDSFLAVARGLLAALAAWPVGAYC